MIRLANFIPQEGEPELPPLDVPRRPNPSQQGVEIPVGLNAYRVTKYPSSEVYQYDVLIVATHKDVQGKDVKPIVMKKVWDSKPVQNELNRAGPGWIYDGNRLAW